jgi:hypothetical protein
MDRVSTFSLGYDRNAKRYDVMKPDKVLSASISGSLASKQTYRTTWANPGFGPQIGKEFHGLDYAE